MTTSDLADSAILFIHGYNFQGSQESVLDGVWSFEGQDIAKRGDYGIKIWCKGAMSHERLARINLILLLLLDPRRFQWASGKVIFDGLHMEHCDYVLLPGEGA